MGGDGEGYKSYWRYLHGGVCWGGVQILLKISPRRWGGGEVKIKLRVSTKKIMKKKLLHQKIFKQFIF